MQWESTNLFISLCFSVLFVPIHSILAFNSHLDIKFSLSAYLLFSKLENSYLLKTDFQDDSCVYNFLLWM